MNKLISVQRSLEKYTNKMKELINGNINISSDIDSVELKNVRFTFITKSEIRLLVVFKYKQKNINNFIYENIRFIIKNKSNNIKLTSNCIDNIDEIDKLIIDFIYDEENFKYILEYGLRWNDINNNINELIKKNIIMTDSRVYFNLANISLSFEDNMNLISLKMMDKRSSTHIKGFIKFRQRENQELELIDGVFNKFIKNIEDIKNIINLCTES